MYLKNKGILKISIFLFKVCIDLGELVDCFWGSVKRGTLVFWFLRVDGFCLIFILTTTSVDHNDRRGHFVQRIFLVCFGDQCQIGNLIINKGELGMAHPVGWGLEFLVQPHYCSHWSKSLRRVFTVPVRYGPELRLADQCEYDSWLSFIGQPIRNLFDPDIDL